MSILMAEAVVQEVGEEKEDVEPRAGDAAAAGAAGRTNNKSKRRRHKRRI